MDAALPARERAAQGRAVRGRVPRSAHADWTPAPHREDPVTILTRQDADRLQWLVPVRHERMAESPFAFFRGSAAIMAADLADSPTMGETVQLCGDAHLANFGTFATPERRQVFDVNDFDETLPGPWEWDLKRLTASVVIAARENGYPKDGEQVARATAASYRSAMAAFAKEGTLDVWYAQLTLEQLKTATQRRPDRRLVAKSAAKARRRTSQEAVKKLTETVDGRQRILSQPPLLVPLRDFAPDADPETIRAALSASFANYRSSLLPDRAALLQRFEMEDVALKVVGVGSVGTQCFIVLLRDLDHGEPLFLQVKQATASVLEAHLPPSTYAQHGERVVTGRRLMQAASDAFLGWSTLDERSGFYWRQFRDMKGSADVLSMTPTVLRNYGSLCGWTLAHAHARTGDRIAISAYLGSGTAMERALARFAEAYADQNERDYEAFVQARSDGRIGPPG